jgi:hypothetical protein
MRSVLQKGLGYILGKIFTNSSGHPELEVGFFLVLTSIFNLFINIFGK